MLAKELTSLQDIEGVEGSFAFNRGGRLIAKIMPPIYADELFDDIGRRVTNLFETVDEHLQPADEYFARFETHVLLLRRREACILGIMALPDTNFTGLRLASKVVLKRLNDLLRNGATASPGTSFQPRVVSDTTIAPRAAALLRQGTNFIAKPAGSTNQITRQDIAAAEEARKRAEATLFLRRKAAAEEAKKKSAPEEGNTTQRKKGSGIWG